MSAMCLDQIRVTDIFFLSSICEFFILGRFRIFLSSYFELHNYFLTTTATVLYYHILEIILHIQFLLAPVNLPYHPHPSPRHVFLLFLIISDLLLTFMSSIFLVSTCENMYLSFCAWLILLDIMCLNSIHFASSDRI